MKTLKTFEFKQAAEAFKAKHDWSKILDCQIHQLDEGVDYQCKSATFRTLASAQAKKRGMGVRINAVEGGLVLQAYVKEGTPENPGGGEQPPTTPKKGRKRGGQS